MQVSKRASIFFQSLMAFTFLVGQKSEAAFQPLITQDVSESSAFISIFDLNGDVFEIYSNDTNVVFTGSLWNFNDSSWNAPQGIADSTLILSPGNGISPNGQFRVAAWSDTTTFELSASLDSGSGFTALPPITQNVDPFSFNLVSAAVNNFGEVAILSLQDDAPAGTTDTFYVTIWNGTSWTQTTLNSFPTATTTTNVSQVRVDSQGNFYFVMSVFETATQTVTPYFTFYNRSTASFSPVVQIDSVTDGLATSALVLTATSPNGEYLGVQVALRRPGFYNLYGFTYHNGIWTGPAIITPGPIYPARNSSYTNKTNGFGINDSGISHHAYALLDGGIYTLYSAMVNGTSVTTTPVTSITNGDIAIPRSTIDNFNNAAILWFTTTPSLPSPTQSQSVLISVLSGLSGTWSSGDEVASALVADFFYDLELITINSSGAVIGNFDTFSGITANGVQINIVVGLDEFIPQPVSNLTAVARRTKFATQTDYYNVISWTASPDPTVVSYRLYRNGKLIATFPASSPLVYEDHNRKKGATYTYQVNSVNSSGVESPATTVVVTD